MKYNKKGFTLIELMVVIAIIAILATVVLVSLSSARNAAEDANRIAAAGQIRSIAQVYYSTGDLDYNDLPGVGGELDEITAKYGLNTGTDGTDDAWAVTGTMGNFLYVNGNGDNFCASIQLNEEYEAGSNKFFCVDASLTGGKTEGNNCNSGSVSCTP
jgi:prepilin-type N-terminal cleavage/methylation domain-containing protein